MKWRLISKAAAPAAGTYKDWKPQLAEESAYQCVYCCIHESKFGGQRNFHVEHWRPKARFPYLENDYANLFYACGICNSFKGDDWPNDPVAEDLSVIAYPDPSKVDYSSILEVDTSNGFVSSPYRAGLYLVERTYLNRPQMVTLRLMSFLIEELRTAKIAVETMHKAEQLSLGDTRRAMTFILRLAEFFDRLGHARPYSASQVRRQ
jgi:hypothetical protein